VRNAWRRPGLGERALKALFLSKMFLVAALLLLFWTLAALFSELPALRPMVAYAAIGEVSGSI
jgi:hypothetical protein